MYRKFLVCIFITFLRLFFLQKVFSQETTKIIVVRNVQFLGRYQPMKVHINGELLKIKSGEVKELFISEDTLKVESRIIRSSKLAVPVQKGGQYKIRVRIGGLFADKPKLTLVEGARYREIL